MPIPSPDIVISPVFRIVLMQPGALDVYICTSTAMCCISEYCTFVHRQTYVQDVYIVDLYCDILELHVVGFTLLFYVYLCSFDSFEMQEKEENAQNLPEQVSEQVEISETELPEQASGPLDEGPKEGEKESSPVDNCEDKVEGNNEAGATIEVLDEGTSEVKADVESDEPQETGQASEENQNIVSEEVVEQTGTKVEGLDTEQEESKVEEKNIDVEEQLPVDDQDSNPCAELDKPENIESAVESEPVEKIEPDAAVEDEQVTQVEAEPALEVSNIPEEATSVNTIEPEKSDNVEETVPLESVDKETDSINDELVPREKIEEVVAEELEPEKLDPESMPEQTSTEVPANEEPKVVDEVKTNTEEKELEPEQPPQMVEPEQPPQMVEPEQPPQMVETEQPPQMVEPEKKPDTTEIGVGLNVLHDYRRKHMQ